jgi:protein TonB
VTRASFLYVASFGAHALLAAGVVSLKGARKAEDVSIAVIEKAESETKKAPPPPPAVPAPTAEARAKAAPRPAAARPPVEAAPPAAAAAAGNDVPDFGLSLGGAGSGGLAVPSSSGRPAPAAAPTVQVSKKLLAAPAAARHDECADPERPPTKPKVLSIAQPSYTEDARAANVAGKVRVELTVDATGHVSSARVLEGLGHGLDEAALAAARAATFEPGTRCGKPAASTFVIAMRFAL